MSHLCPWVKAKYISVAEANTYQQFRFILSESTFVTASTLNYLTVVFFSLSTISGLFGTS
ncbi:hypothetical protein GCM10008986_11250 [Salinibacillus aidingensis]|uniref:Uncharacterized protein n=1 Tax=Salinibacillus aidingensis TaxID=237684 RepID=A0ABN1AZZ2_9BACI